MATTNIQSFSGKIEVNGTTPSSSKTTGALTVAGGVGVTSNIHASNLFASDYVAIGTTSPGQKLEVGHYGGALSSDLGAIRITNHATNLHATSLARFDISLGDIGSNTGSGKRKLIFNSKTTTTDSGTDILCLDGQTNNVGIGKASPTSRLDVSDLSNSKTTPTLTLNHSGVFDYADPQPSVWQSIDFTTEASGTRTRQCGINLLNYSSAGTGQNGIADRLRTGLGFSVHNENGMVENALVINKDGSVGIGTTNPGTPLHVLVPDIGNTTEVLRLENGDGTGDIVSTSGGFIGMHLRDNNVGGGEVARISWKHDGTDSSTEGLGQLGFWTSNTGGSGPGVPVERMTIRANGNVGIGTANPTAQLTLGASSGSQIAVTDNTRLLSNTHYLNYGSDVATDFEQVLLQFDTGGTGDSDQSEYAGYIDVEMVAQRTTSTYYGPEIFTARLNYVLGWNEASNLWRFTTFVQENKSVSGEAAQAFTVFRSVPVFKYKYVDRQLQVYVSFNANWFRGYTSFTARVTSDAPADVSMPGSDALMASGTVGTAEIGMCYGYGAYAANVGIGSYSPGTKLDVAGVGRFTQNGGNLQLVGTDHTYLEYYPDGMSAGRKAYVGYASADDNNFTISNSAGSGHIVLGSGNVGIAVSQDPFTKLTIGSSASADGDIDEIGFRSINNTANDRIGYIQRIGFYGKAEYSNTPILNGAIECLFGDNQHYPTYPGHSSTNLIFKTNSRGGGTGIEKMRITYDGRLGLGTTNPNQGNLTVSALGADPYFTGYSENAAADATDFTGLAHFKSTGSHGVIRISNSAGKTGSTRIDFNTTLGAYWGTNTPSNSYFRGTAPTAGRIMVSGEIDDNYEDAYMTFHTCRDLRPDGQGGTGNLYERMRITSTGRVGIGTDSPNATLHVNGSLLCGSPTTHQTSTAGVGRHITRVTSDVNVTGLSQTVRLNGAQQSGIVKIHYQAGAANTSGALQHSCYAVIGFSWGGGTNFYTYEHSKTEKTTTTISFTVNTDGYVTLSVSTGSSFGSYCSLYTEWFYGATGGAGLYV
jgi:hypothetical protein